ncbi:glycyl-radical enzyme activating protein, partial [candidate division CSSED10-310 bacterium]
EIRGQKSAGRSQRSEVRSQIQSTKDIKNRALVADLKRNSLDDGPGIRTVIFFKGCPLRCIWCHNPETKKARPELTFKASECIGCGDCAAVCSVNAIDCNDSERINRSVCNVCLDCVDVCPAEALKVTGQFYTVAELYRLIMRDEPFFRFSGGGVTYSGGEPTVYLHFLRNLSAQLKESNITVTLETCGYYKHSLLETELLPFIDQLFFDLKFVDPELHKQYTSRTNDLIIKNLLHLVENPETREKLLVRIPLVPDVTATARNLSEITKFLKDKGIWKVELLEYNPTWHDKALNLGHDLQYNHSKFMTSSLREQVKLLFSDFDIGKF